MKKTFAILMVVMALAVSSVMGALQFTLDDSNVHVGQGESVDVELIVTNNAVPVLGLVIDVEEYCREHADPNYGCNVGDAYSPAELDVVVTSPTDVDGKATITLTHDGSDVFGNYHFTICDDSEDNCGEGGASVTGDAYIPEFTAIGAGLALLGAGLYTAKRRKKN